MTASEVTTGEVIMPRLSDSMEEGTVLTWLKAVGDEVAVGDELVEIETDKANMVHEADIAGTLAAIVVAEGETVAVGEVIARIGSDGDAPTAEPALAAESAAPAAEPPSDGAPRVKASPVSKRLASEHGIELAGLEGSGPGGRVVKADVEAAIAARDDSLPQPAPAPPPASSLAPAGGGAQAEAAKGSVEAVELTKLQRTVARRMAESKATAPHFYLTAEIDMGACVAARAQLKASAADEDIVPSFNDMVVKACALALREFPRANGAYRDGRVELHSRVNVGIAVATPDALVVPTVFDADTKGLRQIAAEARELAERVRSGAVTPPELAGGTFTVSNLGMFGISNFAAVINPPQAGILAVGQIAERPVARSGELAIAPVMEATLACDHRILYGAEGSRFLGRVRALLEAPVGLAL